MWVRPIEFLRGGNFMQLIPTLFLLEVFTETVNRRSVYRHGRLCAEHGIQNRFFRGLCGGTEHGIQIIVLDQTHGMKGLAVIVNDICSRKT